MHFCECVSECVSVNVFPRMCFQFVFRGNESSVLVSDSRSISVLLKTVCFRLQNLFLMEFILRWPMISFFGYVRHCLFNPIRSSFSVSEDSERKGSFVLLLLSVNMFVGRFLDAIPGVDFLIYSFFYPYSYLLL